MARDGDGLFRRRGIWQFKYKDSEGVYREKSTGKRKQTEAREYKHDFLEKLQTAPTANRRGEMDARPEALTAAELIAWQRELAARWRNVGFGRVKISTHDGRHRFLVEVRLGGIRPDDVQAELYADAVDSDVPYRSAILPCGAVEGGFLYTGSAPASRPTDKYTPSVIPRNEGVFIPAENALIAWR